MIVVFPDYTHLLFLTCNFLRTEYYIQQGDINNIIRLVDKALYRLAWRKSTDSLFDFYGITYHVQPCYIDITVLPAKSESDVMFCF